MADISTLLRADMASLGTLIEELRQKHQHLDRISRPKNEQEIEASVLHNLESSLFAALLNAEQQLYSVLQSTINPNLAVPVNVDHLAFAAKRMHTHSTAFTASPLPYPDPVLLVSRPNSLFASMDELRTRFAAPTSQKMDVELTQPEISDVGGVNSPMQIEIASSSVLDIRPVTTVADAKAPQNSQSASQDGVGSLSPMISPTSLPSANNASNVAPASKVGRTKPLISFSAIDSEDDEEYDEMDED